ncbi:Class II abasic (AP) endonuclease [Paramarasmius palmivorus]|uniref:Class II abasic (AP) endonuclease n=1 Tax=Paramarasmius palmivorus TaxID=297713 RepID=A0AAW0BLI7_9AGAR
MVSSSYDEPAHPVKLGVGSFAAVFIIRGGPVAYKEVLDFSDAEVLRREYSFLDAIYRECNVDSFFAVPPSDGHTVMSTFSRPTYAMDRVPAAKHLACLYLPKEIAQLPALCRLYFGKDYTNAPAPRFFNTENFPLDQSRYMRLCSEFPDILSPLNEVVEGMGEMLARLHFKASVDARNVEFVLGDGAGGFTFFLIDFNQVRPWTPSIDNIHELVSAFFVNDPYYPRPRSSDATYVKFRHAYLEACNDESRFLGGAFIEAIEAKQKDKDTAFQG